MDKGRTSRRALCKAVVPALAAALGARAAIAETRPPPPRRQSPVVGQTIMFFDEAHGTQVEYYGYDGFSHLWYPGNTKVVRAAFREDLEQGIICFYYGSNVYNIERDAYGTDEWCHALETFRSEVKDEISGDLFHLESRDDVPFVLSREPTDLLMLYARAVTGLD